MTGAYELELAKPGHVPGEYLPEPPYNPPDNPRVDAYTQLRHRLRANDKTFLDIERKRAAGRAAALWFAAGTLFGGAVIWLLEALR
jgi:hypothetical protein